MTRTPTRATQVRQEPESAAPKKVRVRKNAAQRSLLDIPADIVDALKAENIDLQWVTDSVLGQPAPQNRMAFEINGWEAVTPDMFNGIFDGMFTRKGHKGEINYEGLVLMWRPLELTLEAQHEDNQARENALMAQMHMMKTGEIAGFTPGFETRHPSVNNVVNRAVRPPMEIPKD